MVCCYWITISDLEIGLTASVSTAQLRWPSGKSARLWSCRLEFDSKFGQTNDFKVGVHSFPACRSAMKEKCGEQAGKFTCCAVGQSLSWIYPSWCGRQVGRQLLSELVIAL